MTTKIRFLALVFLMIVGMFGFGCVAVHDHTVYAPEQQGPPPWAPAHGHRAKHHYYYYPDSHVYYDTERKVYFYPSAGDWRVSAVLPPGIRIDVGGYTALEMDNDRPYIYHEEVVKKYPPGQLKKLEKGKKKNK
jgi:hypothetical protein